MLHSTAIEGDDACDLHECARILRTGSSCTGMYVSTFLWGAGAVQRLFVSSRRGGYCTTAAEDTRIRRAEQLAL